MLICCDGELSLRRPNTQCCGPKTFDSETHQCCRDTIISKAVGCNNEYSKFLFSILTSLNEGDQFIHQMSLETTQPIPLESSTNGQSQKLGPDLYLIVWATSTNLNTNAVSLRKADTAQVNPSRVIRYDTPTPFILNFKLVNTNKIVKTNHKAKLESFIFENFTLF